MQKYFSWGDIKGQNKNGSGSYSFSENNYKAGICGKGHTLTGNIPQGNATYDAARANLDAPYKMPTNAQGKELVDGTTSEWTSINSVNGRKFISKTDTSKYIFIPAAGNWRDMTYENSGTFGHYWSTIYSSSNYTSSFAIYISAAHTFVGDYTPALANIRWRYGLSIRPIK